MAAWSAPTYSRTTPSDVFSRIKAIESVINNVSKNKRQRIDTIKLLDAKPLHVYALATALNEKIIMLNHSKQHRASIRPAFPAIEITPSQVMTIMIAIEKNLKILSPSSLFTFKAFNNKQPKDVLRILIRCNLLLDTMLEPLLLPHYPYRVVLEISQLLTNALPDKQPSVHHKKFVLYPQVKPKDVFVNAENMFNTLMSSTYLKFNIQYPKKPYYAPYNEKNIKPIHVFTMTVMNRVLLKDFLRRNGHLTTPQSSTDNLEKIKPAHVYQQYEKALLLLRYYLAT